MDPHDVEETILSQNPNTQNIDHEKVIDVEKEEEIPPRGNQVIIKEDYQIPALQEEQRTPQLQEEQQIPPSQEEKQIPPRQQMPNRNV